MLKAAIAMSGGVDSSAAAYILQNSGYLPIGVTFIMCDSTSDEGAAAVCKKMNIKHTTVDVRDEFRNLVMMHFADDYISGKTPNPCVICNKSIKFPHLLDFMKQNGCSVCATGHYARTVRDGDRVLLKKGVDKKKDQSYVLWSLKPEILKALRFPLGEYTKDEIRTLAEEASLPSAKSKESQDICFIPDGNYAAFIERLTGAFPTPGNFISSDGTILGQHAGQIRYTIGQGRGLGIALGTKMYVTDKDPVKNTVTLGCESELFTKTVRAGNINIIAADSLEGAGRLTARIRYNMAEKSAEIIQSDEDEITAIFDEGVRAPAKGQSLVIYDGDTVVAGGIIK